MLRQRRWIERPTVGNHLLQFQKVFLPKFASPEFAERPHPKKREPHFLLEIRLEWRRDPDPPLLCFIHQLRNPGPLWKIKQLQKTVNAAPRWWVVRFNP